MRRVLPPPLRRQPPSRLRSWPYRDAIRLPEQALAPRLSPLFLVIWLMVLIGHTYDGGYNRLTKVTTNTVGNSTTTIANITFAYNSQNELTGFVDTAVSRTVSYQYDAHGNRVLKIDSAFSGNASDSGNPLGNITYNYDAENRLTDATVFKNAFFGADMSIVGSTPPLYIYNLYWNQYVYDYRGRRLARAELTGNTDVAGMVYELYSGGTPVRKYGQVGATPGGVMETPTFALTAEYIRGSDWGGGVGGILYSLRTSGNTTAPSYYHYDGRGDVIAQANGSGCITYQSAYDSFGTHANSGNHGTEEFGSSLDRFRTNTKEEDPTGLSYQNHRYLDLETNTWMTPDPLGDVDGPNHYAYVGQNPWTKFDPEGLMTGQQYDDQIASLTTQAQTQQKEIDRLNAESKDPKVDKDTQIEDRERARNLDDNLGNINRQIARDKAAKENLVEVSARYNKLESLTGGKDSLHAETLDDSSDLYRQARKLYAATNGIAITVLTAGVGELIAGVSDLIDARQAAAARAVGEEALVPEGVGGCFAAGTLVSTDNGLKPIEEIQTGDRVWSYDEVSGKNVLQSVLRTFEHPNAGYVRLQIGNAAIVATSEHPFWVENVGWVGAGELKIGDLIKTMSGATKPVMDVQISAEEITVYNFEVEVTHTYFVSNTAFLVHNACKVPRPGVSAAEGAKDVPSWARGTRPNVGENGKNFAQRLLDTKYGPGNYKTGPGSEFSQIQKYGDRSFQDP